MQLESSLPLLKQPAIYLCPQPDQASQAHPQTSLTLSSTLLLTTHYSVDHIEKIEKGGTCSTYGGEERCVYRVLFGKPEGKKRLGRPRRRWEDNIKIYLQEVSWGEWTGLIWHRIGAGGGLW